MKKTLSNKVYCQILKGIVLLTTIFNSVSLSAQDSDSIIFKDNFNRLSLGTFWQSHPSWSIQGGSAYNYIDGTGGSLRTTDNFKQTSYIIETTARGFTNNYMREYRITFGQENLSKDSLYELIYKPYDGGILTLAKAADNIYFPKTLDEAVIYPQLGSTDKYKFKIAKYKSGLIQVYIDKGSGYEDTPFLEAIDSTYISAGHIGWQIDTETFAESFYVDDILAIKPAIEKPAVKEKPAEDNLITQVSAKSGNLYKVSKLNSGTNVYTDKNYNITFIPDYLKGASFVQTSMKDKKDVLDTFLTLFIKKAAIVYIGYDSRATILPSWLSDWTKTGDSIETSNTERPYLQVYSKLMEYGDIYPAPLLLGGNLAGHAYGSETNYIVAAVERPAIMHLQAEDAFLSGAIAANNHPGYNGTGFADFIHDSNDYIEWTVKIDAPGTYDLGFNFTNGTNADRPLKIDNDGTNIGTGSFSSTSSWSWWAFYSGLKVYLTRGVHKIRATATGFNGPNIDELSLYYESPSDLSTIAERNTRNNNFTAHPSDISIKAYPNPFIQSTTILYSLKEKSKVTLSVYTMQGQQIQTLVNEIKSAGEYQVTFEAGKLSAGSYFYQLRTGNELKTGKLLKE